MKSVYCRLRAQNVGIELEGQLKFFTLNYSSDENGESGEIVYVQSSECPENLYSKLRIDRFGRVKEMIDCHHTSLVELALTSGLQQEISDEPETEETKHFAISGPGYFVLKCDDGFLLTRNGSFIKEVGKLTRAGCSLQNSLGEDFANGDDFSFDSRGCNSAGQCIEVVNPTESAELGFKSPTDFSTHSTPISSLLREPYVFQNSREEFSTPKSAPGPDWSEIPTTEPENCFDLDSANGEM